MVPVGGGSGAAGACMVAKAVRPSVEVIGVQSAGGTGGLPFLAGRLAGGGHHRARSPKGWPPGPRSSYRSEILRELLDDFVLVSDDDTAAPRPG